MMRNLPGNSLRSASGDLGDDVQLWDELARRLEEFLQAWEATESGAPPPDLAPFLPEQPRALRRVVLQELIKLDMERRAAQRSGESPALRFRPLEEYVEKFPGVCTSKTGEPAVELIYEEFHVRRSSGENVSYHDYSERFPASRESLRKLLGAHGVSVTSALRPVRQLDAIQVGELLDDFELLSELGRGAFARVFLARQRSMQRLVALKVSADKGDEPQTLAQLDHPHIVRVYDQRRLEERKLRLLYMQFAPGGTLYEVIQLVRRTPPSQRSGAILVAAVDAAMQKTGQAISEDAAWRRRAAAAEWPDMICRLGAQLCNAIAYAHRQDVLHRDIKPANVLLSAEGTTKLADFNISFGTHVANATPDAFFGGSLAYMSPEQLEACSPQFHRRPDELDGRADLYSVGVMLWEMLYGERPFADPSLDDGWHEVVATLVDQRRQGNLQASPSASGGRGAVARRLNRVLARAMAPEPDERYQNGAELARDLTLCLHGRSWDLFNDLGGSWRGLARRQPLALIIPVNVLPHALAGLYNWYFNYAMFVQGAGEEFERAFWITTWVINGTAFPLGVALGSGYAWPVVRLVWRLARGLACAPDERAFARRRALRMGQVIALIGLAEWLLSGILIPVLMHLLAGRFTTMDYLHFFASLAACGLTATAFPYLGTTWLAVRVFYPALLASDAPDPREQQSLAELPQQAGYYVAIAAVVPMLAMLLVLFEARENRLLAGVLMAAGLIGFVAAWLAYGRIRSDVEALTIATRATDSLRVDTGMTDSF